MNTDTKRDAKVSGIIGGTLVVATIALFVLFRPAEPSVVYWFNFAFSLLLEVLFSGLFVFGKSRQLSMPFYIATWTYIGCYIVLSICTMGIYFALVEPGVLTLATELAFPKLHLPYARVFDGIAAIFQENESLGSIIYFSVFIALTAIWIITIAILWRTDVAYTESVQKLKQTHEEIINFAQQATLLNKKYQRICQEKGIRYETHSNNSSVLDKLVNKIQFLTPNVLQSPVAQRRLTELLAECKTIINEADAATEDQIETVNKKMNSFVLDAVDEIDMLKNTTRK